ncbi:hypothetical protein Tco_1337850 [Tanacetum coccineum]
MQQDGRGSVTGRFRMPSADQLTSAEGNRITTLFSTSSYSQESVKAPVQTRILSPASAPRHTFVLTSWPIREDPVHNCCFPKFSPYERSQQSLFSPPSPCKNTCGERGNEQVVKKSDRPHVDQPYGEYWTRSESPRHRPVGRTESVLRKRHYEGTCSRRTYMLSESEDSGGTLEVKIKKAEVKLEAGRLIKPMAFLKGEVAASNHVRKKTLLAWKQQEVGRKQNFERRGDFMNQQRSERRRNKFTLLTKSPKETLALDKGKIKTSSPTN